MALSCPLFSPLLRCLLDQTGQRAADAYPDLVITSVCSLSRFDLRVNQIFQLLREGAQVFDEVLSVHVAS